MSGYVKDINLTLSMSGLPSSGDNSLTPKISLLITGIVGLYCYDGLSVFGKSLLSKIYKFSMFRFTWSQSHFFS